MSPLFNSVTEQRILYSFKSPDFKTGCEPVTDNNGIQGMEASS